MESSEGHLGRWNVSVSGLRQNPSIYLYFGGLSDMYPHFLKLQDGRLLIYTHRSLDFGANDDGYGVGLRGTVSYTCTRTATAGTSRLAGS